jgi:hypothetical protein
MKKTALTILGTVVIAAAAGGFAALSVNNYLAAKGGYERRALSFSQNDTQADGATLRPKQVITLRHIRPSSIPTLPMRQRMR